MGANVKAIHAICHRVDGVPQNLRQIDPRNGICGSGWWKVPPEEAESLQGGWIYLHESSATRSHFLARIQSLGGDGGAFWGEDPGGAVGGIWGSSGDDPPLGF
jgi:hypothetical protein